MRQFLTSTLIAIPGILAGACPASAVADVFVVAHPSTQIAAEEIRDIFLGDRQFAGNTRLIPVDNGATQEKFLSQVLRMDSAKYNSSWTKKSFRHGLNPPPLKSGDAEVLDYIRRTPGAVGYVSSTPTGVTIIRQF